MKTGLLLYLYFINLYGEIWRMWSTNREEVAFKYIELHISLKRYFDFSIEDEIESLDDEMPILQPICDKDNSEMNRVTEVVQFSQTLQYKAELDMAERLMMISGTQSDTLQGLGTKIAFALKKVIHRIPQSHFLFDAHYIINLCRSWWISIMLPGPWR